jgi:hypothetical protein
MKNLLLNYALVACVAEAQRQVQALTSSYQRTFSGNSPSTTFKHIAS